jgi:folylpolyglutamate synthase/dihydropteroate synthase
VGAAVEHALALAAPDDIVLVTGSLYTVGNARSACRRLGLLNR